MRLYIYIYIYWFRDSINEDFLAKSGVKAKQVKNK